LAIRGIHPTPKPEKNDFSDNYYYSNASDILRDKVEEVHTDSDYATPVTMTSDSDESFLDGHDFLKGLAERMQAKSQSTIK
jgi:hypothetical protein